MQDVTRPANMSHSSLAVLYHDNQKHISCYKTIADACCYESSIALTVLTPHMRYLRGTFLVTLWILSHKMSHVAVVTLL